MAIPKIKIDNGILYFKLEEGKIVKTKTVRVEDYIINFDLAKGNILLGIEIILI